MAISRHQGTGSVYKQPGFIQPAYSINSVSAESDLTSEPSHKFVFDVYISENFGAYTKVARIKSLPSQGDWSTIEYSDLVRNYVEDKYLHENPEPKIEFQSIGEDKNMNYMKRYVNLIRIKILVGEEYRVNGVVTMFTGNNQTGEPSFPLIEYYTTYQALSSSDNETFRVKESGTNKQINALHLNYMDFISKGINNQTVWGFDQTSPVGWYQLLSEEVVNIGRDGGTSYLDKTFTDFSTRYLSNQPTERRYSTKTPTYISYMEGTHLNFDENGEGINTNQGWVNSFVGKAFDEYYKDEDLRFWHYYNMLRQRCHTVGYEFFDINKTVIGEIRYQPESNIFGNPMKTGLADGEDFPGYSDVYNDTYKFSKWSEVEFAAYPEITDVDQMNNEPNQYNSLLSSNVNYGLWTPNNLLQYIEPQDKSSWDWDSGSPTMVVEVNQTSGVREMRDDCIFTSSGAGNSLTSQPGFLNQETFVATPDYHKPAPFRNWISSFGPGTMITGITKELSNDVANQTFEHYAGKFTKFQLNIDTINYQPGQGEVKVEITYWNGSDYVIGYDSGWQTSFIQAQQFDVQPPVFNSSSTEEEATAAISAWTMGYDYPDNPPTTYPGRLDRIFISVSFRNVTNVIPRRIDINLLERNEANNTWIEEGNTPNLWYQREQNYLRIKPEVIGDYDNIFKFNNGRTDSQIYTMTMDVKQLTEKGTIPGHFRNLIDMDSNQQPIFKGEYWYSPYIEMAIAAGITPTRAPEYSWFQPMVIGNDITDYDFSAALGFTLESNEQISVDNVSRFMQAALGVTTLFQGGYVAANGEPPLQILSSKSLPNGINNKETIHITFKMSYGGNGSNDIPNQFSITPMLFQGTRPGGEKIEVSNIKLFTGETADDSTKLFGAVDYRINIYDTLAPINIINSSVCDAGTMQANINGVSTQPYLSPSNPDVQDTIIKKWWNDDVDGFYDFGTDGQQIGTPRKILYLLASGQPNQNYQSLVTMSDAFKFDDTALYYTEWLNSFNIYEPNKPSLYENRKYDFVVMVVDMMVYVENNGDADDTSHLYVDITDPVATDTYTFTEFDSKYESSDRGTWKRIWKAYVGTASNMYSMMKTNQLQGDINLKVYVNSGQQFGTWNTEYGISDVRAYFLPNSAISETGTFDEDINAYSAKHYANSQRKINVGKEPYYKLYNDLKMNDAYSLFWLNPYGQWDNYRFKGKSTKTVDTTRTQRGLGLGQTGDLTGTFGQLKQSYGDGIDYNVNAFDIYELRTGYIDDDERSWLEELMVSPKIFMYDEKTGFYQRVNNLTGDYTNIKQKNQSLYQLSLEAQVSQERRTQQVLGLK